MEIRQFQRLRWYLRLFNLLLIAGLILLIVFNCHPMPWWLITLISVIGLMILLTGRVWCSFCPCGLLFGWLNAISPLKLEKDSTKCLSCGACSKLCPMQSKRISIQKTNGAVYSAECMMCGECIGKCPAAGAIKLTVFGKPRRMNQTGSINSHARVRFCPGTENND